MKQGTAKTLGAAALGAAFAAAAAGPAFAATGGAPAGVPLHKVADALPSGASQSVASALPTARQGLSRTPLASLDGRRGLLGGLPVGQVPGGLPVGGQAGVI